MSVSVSGVDFITVFVKDYPAAQEFYGGLLGLEHAVDYGRIPAGEYETGNLTLQVMDAASIGQEFSPRAPADRPARRRRRSRPRRARGRRASPSTARRSTAASATWRTSATPTATC